MIYKKKRKKIKKLVDEFKRKMNTEIRWQERLGRVRKVKLNQRTEEVKRSELLERYIVKLLFRWNNGKFEDKKFPIYFYTIYTSTYGLC